MVDCRILHAQPTGHERFVVDEIFQPLQARLLVLACHLHSDGLASDCIGILRTGIPKASNLDFQDGSDLL